MLIRFIAHTKRGTLFLLTAASIFCEIAPLLPEHLPGRSLVYYIKWSVVAFFSVNPMNSVNPMSVKVMYHCIVYYLFLWFEIVEVSGVPVT